MKRALSAGILIGIVVFLAQCEKDDPISADGYLDLTKPTRYHLEVPPGFPDYFLDKENELTYEGIALGRKLFFDPILSKNRNVSCASCHEQEFAFADPRVLSIGTEGAPTKFHSMPLFNMAWMNEFFWNGRAKSREAQALQPVTNPVEMNLSWDEAVKRLQEHPEYPMMFKAAFGTDVIDSNLAAKAMVQYEMTLVSSNSKYDGWIRGELDLNELESLGESIFNSERGDCFHCHGNVLTTDNIFHNTGLDGDEDLRPGLAEVTGLESDYGKFKTPTLRNLAYTAPYMHDGRFETIDEVIDFYSEGVKVNRNIDVLMEFAFQGGVQLSDIEKEALKAFLLTMTDTTFVTNPEIGRP